ncbi:uncharacterized protein METZ01_LOCUS450735, partial [marine metagenome]
MHGSDAFSSQIFKNKLLRIVFVNCLNKSILWGLIFSFAPTISLGEVPE